MSEAKHDPEPWRATADAQPDKGRFYWHIVAADGLCKAEGKDNADARRIVACVNACRGLPTKALEAGALARALDVLRSAAETPGIYRYVRGAARKVLRSLGRLP